ncbi:MAG: molybdopterin biosynthesis protein MoeY [Hydrogenophilales bacterium 16-64-46]|nr:MAG: molybdopterin biosynthesis protein MoeY [Hydrogenophilales bacterium 12-64-13]OYZ06576.1 MAG: molybdopterin biosynthesis protein MoeY [Hydrogenophilales bacterium 16-64-46]OZA39284.1 MAG: molybdopterin biosynthesis protein MoeY [Hydrogenophilales bacterium 17-64-34]HQS98839.1 molybdopterin biosynthesis protein MoeY [Thiobacillus sp.]
MAAPPDSLIRIIDDARWAPSGDNTQPWHIEIVDAHHLRVHGADTRDHCVYDLDGHSSHLAHGALIETLAIAATAQGARADITREPGSTDTHPVYRVVLEDGVGGNVDSLYEYIRLRSVQRRPLSTRKLEDAHRQTLHDAVAPHYKVIWFEGAEKRRMAALMFANAKLRLTLPEAYPVHRDIIDWNARFSSDKVPDQALGLDPGTLKLMRWVMGSWNRVRFFNTYLAGHLVPRLEMDWLPGLMCAAHFGLVASRPARSVDDYVAAGRALQRFWLTATRLGLQLQPEQTPLIFDRYLRQGRAFTTRPELVAYAANLATRLRSRLPAGAAGHTVFLGRLGYGVAASSRSLRLDAERLIKTGT